MKMLLLLKRKLKGKLVLTEKTFEACRLPSVA
jgi:hypothetical protein